MDKTPVGVILIGLTGSGKSTLARRLANTQDYSYISSGDIAREIAEMDPIVEADLNKGDYAPENAIRMEVVAQIENALVRHDGFVLEGFPRRVEQLVIVEQLAARRAFDPVYLHLDVPLLTAIRRLAQRQRRGDSPDSIGAKYDSFVRHTVPMIAALGPDAFRLPADMTETYVFGKALDIVKGMST